MIDLNSAAVVKLVHTEAESAALRDWLAERAETGRTSSVLAEVESFRALARYAPEAAARLPAVLDQIDPIELDASVRMLAQAVRPATVRSLDAIHLGAAIQTGHMLTSFVTYDKRLLNAATAVGLPASAPGWPADSRSLAGRAGQRCNPTRSLERHMTIALRNHTTAMTYLGDH